MYTTVCTVIITHAVAARYMCHELVTSVSLCKLYQLWTLTYAVKSALELIALDKLAKCVDKHVYVSE